MRDKAFIYIISAALLLLSLYAPAYRLLCAAGVAEYHSTGNDIVPERSYDGSGAADALLNAAEEVKAAINDTYINYLPGYTETVLLVNNAKYALNQGINAAYSEAAARLRADRESAAEADVTETAPSSEPLSEEPITLQEPETVEYHFMSSSKKLNNFRFKLTRGEEERAFLDRTIDRTYAECESVALRNAAGINGIAELLPDVNVYVYIGTRLQDTELAEVYFPDDDCLAPVFDAFVGALDERVKVDWLRIDSIDDRFGKLYLTDHHWNAAGADEGYRAIVEMMSENYPDMEAREPAAKYSLDEVIYYGSMARTSSYYVLHDPMTFYDYDLPEHTVIGASGVAKSMERYLGGKFSKERGAAHYEEFYGEPTKLVYPENNTGRVLLTLNDSFMKAIAEPLGSHFDTTYIEYFMSKYGKKLDLRAYCEEKGVTDLLIVMVSYRLLYDTSGDMNTKAINQAK